MSDMLGDVRIERSGFCEGCSHAALELMTKNYKERSGEATEWLLKCSRMDACRGAYMNGLAEGLRGKGAYAKKEAERLLAEKMPEIEEGVKAQLREEGWTGTN